MGTELVHVGFGNIIAANKIIALLAPNHQPTKRLIKEAKNRGLLIDTTLAHCPVRPFRSGEGRRTQKDEDQRKLFLLCYYSYHAASTSRRKRWRGLSFSIPGEVPATA